ncbi:MAG: hypothetical protein AB8B95_07220 [Pseudohongiellaceae bacterium]
MASSQKHMTDHDDFHGETEIVFTATADFDEHFNSIPPASSINSADSGSSEETTPSPQSSCDQDAAAQDQVDRLKAKLEGSQALRTGTDNHAKQLRFRQLIKETRSLNKESEKFNTQSAVLLSALTNLKSEFEESEATKSNAINELISLSNTGKSLLHDLQISKENTEESTANLSAIQQKSERIVENLNRFSEESKEQQQSRAALLNDLQEDIKEITNAKTEAIDNASNVNDLASKSTLLLEDVTVLHQQTSEGAKNLEEALSTHLDKKSELDELAGSLNGLRQELQQENQLQVKLNTQTKNQIQQTEKLNEEQSTLVELTQHRHEELRNELNNCLETAKKYQSKLQLTESKLKDAQLLQERYKDQYRTALEKLESNETLLKNATKALAETNGQNGKFNSAIANFQHTTEQSQQLVIRTQTTLESILTRNQLLERENKILASKLNMQTESTTAPQRSAIPTNGNLNALSDFSFPDSQNPQPQPLNSKNGTFKFMVILALLIPTSFIAYSLLSEVDSNADTQLVVEPEARTNRPLLSAQ